MQTDVNHLLSELESSFQHDFLAAWYPAAVDSINGGFYTNLSAHWSLTAERSRFLIGQSRHLWFSSNVASFCPGKGYEEIARWGYQFIRKHFCDSCHGGLWFSISHSNNNGTWRNANPRKSASSNAFAIFGLAAYYRLTHDNQALTLAKRTFHWLEQHSWDSRYGGYVNCLKLDGRWCRSLLPIKKNVPRRYFGLKDVDSSLHLLEAFTELYSVWPDEMLGKRIHELLNWLIFRFRHVRGFLIPYLMRKGEPFPRGKLAERHTHFCWGHDMEAAYILLAASYCIGHKDWLQHCEIAKSLVDHSLQFGEDTEKGGFYLTGSYENGENEPRVCMTRKVWWVEAEALNALLLMDRLFPAEGCYSQAVLKQWNYIKQYLIDHQNGGWFVEGRDTDPLVECRQKANERKSSYHDGRAYLNCISMLKGRFPWDRLTAE